MKRKQIDIMIAGGQKTGSTSLFEYLKSHPDIVSHLQTEMPFFRSYDPDPESLRSMYKQFFELPELDKKRVYLAKDSMLMYSKDGLKRLHKYNPDIKIIIILRNPVDRAYSAYWFARFRGWELENTFESALEKENERLRTLGWNKSYQTAYVHNGMYGDHIKTIYSIFPEKNIKIYLNEDLKKNPEIICNHLFQWINLDSAFKPDFSIKHNVSTAPYSIKLARIIAWLTDDQKPAKKILQIFIPKKLGMKIHLWFVNYNKRKKAIPPMDPQTRQMLTGKFRQSNKKVEAFIHQSLKQWDQ